MKYLHLSYIIQTKHCPIRGLSTNLGKIHVTRTRNLHPTHSHRRSLARFVESNVCTQAIVYNVYISYICSMWQVYILFSLSRPNVFFTGQQISFATVETTNIPKRAHVERVSFPHISKYSKQQLMLLLR